MKKLLIPLLAVLALAACRKDMAKETTSTPADTELTGGVEPLPPYRWTKFANTYPNEYPYSWLESPNLLMQVNEDDIYFMSGSLFDHLYKFDNSTRTWLPHTTTNTGYMGFGVFSVGYQYLFSYGNKIYLGLMQGGPEFNETFISRMDPVTGVTTDRATFPGVSTDRPLCFVVGNKGYVIAGISGGTRTIWEYNFAANTWTSKGNSPLGKRQDAVAFVVNNKVYMGLGYETATLNGQSLKIYINNWVEYDPATSTTVAKANFPGSGRGRATGFMLGSSPYLGFGRGVSGYLKDFWKYSPGSDTWTQQDSWTGVTPISQNMVGFSQGTTGYVIKAALNEYWKYSRSSLIPVPTP